MSTRISQRVQHRTFLPVHPKGYGLLQHKCACSSTTKATGECEKCRKKQLQRQIGNQHSPVENQSVFLPIVGDISPSHDQPLAPNKRGFMEARVGHNFSQVPVHFSSQRDCSKLSASPVSLGEGPGAQDVTQTPAPIGTTVPAPADGDAVPADVPVPTKKAKLKSVPTYSPSGTIKATKSGGKKTATFNLSAEFEHDPSKGLDAASGETRRYIKWTKAGELPNHAGFKPAASYSENTWYEDRDDVGKRYGHRAGSYSECASINHYEDSKGKQDCVSGSVFKGEDEPQDGSGAKTGEWKFELRAVDISDGDKEIGTPASITVDWNV